MLRGLSIVAVIAGLALPAAADPPPAVEDDTRATTRPSVIDLQLGRGLAPTTQPAPKVDLFPADVLGDGQLVFGTRTGGAKERKPGLTWDGGWKVHATQIGIMAAGFAALVGLCGGGRCMIPDAATSFLPDWARARAPVVPQDRPVPSVQRSAR